VAGTGSPPSGAGAHASARDRLAPLVERVDRSVLGRLWARLLEMEFVERSIALAAKAFVSLLPLLLVVAAFMPPRLQRGILDELAERLGLSGESLEYISGAFASADAIKASTSVFGLILTVLFAVSFTTAVQRVYLRAWRRPASGAIQDKRRALTWLAGTCVFLASVGSIGRLLVGPASVLSWLVGVAGAVCLWWWSAHTFLRGHVRWRPLLPTALVTGLGASIYAGAARIWMPRVLEGNVEQFGFVGVGMSFVTWFVGFGFLLVGAAALGPVLCDGDGALARWLRRDGVLAEGAPAALPGPDRLPSLRDYLRRGGNADTDDI
jgi:membrane protein